MLQQKRKRPISSKIFLNKAYVALFYVLNPYIWFACPEPQKVQSLSWGIVINQSQISWHCTWPSCDPETESVLYVLIRANPFAQIPLIIPLLDHL